MNNSIKAPGHNFSMKEFEIILNLSETPTSINIKKLKNYFNEMPLEEILSGLKFFSNLFTHLELPLCFSR